jgi:hypothetical protein
VDTTAIGNIFGSVAASINDALDPLEKPVSATPPYEHDISIDTGNKSLQLFGTPVTIDAVLSAKVAASAANDVPIQPFDDGSITAINGMTYTALTIDGALSSSGSASATQGAFTVSATASANAKFSYGHYLPVDSSRSRLAAFLDLAKGTTLPQLADLTSLKPGEILDYSSDLGLDLGVSAKAGKVLEVKDTLHILDGVVSGLSLPFTASVSLAVSAAFGLAIAESLRYTVARAGQVRDPNWVRIRCARTEKNQITFSLAINLSIDYDRTSAPKMLLDKAFSLVSGSQLYKTLQEINTNAALAATNWPGFVTSLSNEAVTVVGRLLNDTGWKNAAETSPAVNDLIKAANAIVSFYNGIDKKTQSLVNQLIARLDAAGLDKLQPIIKKVAAIDVNDPDLASLLMKQDPDVVHWIEVLSGQNLDSLVISGALKDALTAVVALAKKIDGFFGGAADGSVVNEISKLLQKSGAAALVAWLSKNATSVQALETAGEQAAGDIVRRLVGKGLNQLSADDVAKIQKFAGELNKLLSAPKVLYDKLKAGIDKLQGTIGFNVGLELSRVSEKSSIVDVEINPADSSAVSAAATLRTGNFLAFLSDLDHIAKSNSGSSLPFLLREVLLTSRHIRTSASTTVLSFLGFSESDQETMLVETSISVQGAGAGTRTATYNGGASVRRSNGSITAEGAAWIYITASGDGPDVTAPYSTVTPVLRLTYSRQDTKTDKKDMGTLRDLLLEIGVTNPAPPSADDAKGQQTNFALQIEFPVASIAALIQKDGTLWETDARMAAHRWFGDQDRASSLEAQAGAEMATVVVDPVFGQNWTDFPPGDKLFEIDQNTGFGGIQIFEPDKTIKGQYVPLRFLMERRSFAEKGFTDFNADLAGTSPKEVLKIVTQASRMFDTLESQWQPPLFNHWLILVRLLRLGALAGAQGLATLQSRADSNSDWTLTGSWMIKGVNATTLQQKFSL